MSPLNRRAVRRVTGLVAVWWLIGLALVMVPTAPASAQNPCDGLVPPRLTVDGSARVTSTYGVSLKDRAATGAAGAGEIALLTVGQVVTVVEGPRCNLGYVWWQVRLADGTIGWAAEGGAGVDYFMEPVAVGLHAFRTSTDGARLLHDFVTPDGRAQPRAEVSLPSGGSSPRQAWQQVELDTLRDQLAAVDAQCPERLTGEWASVASVEDVLDWPLPVDDYDYYPAPSGEQIVLVRHAHLLVPRCETVVPLRVGMSVVEVVRADGTVTPLFPFPQHGSVPQSGDRYRVDAVPDPDLDNWNVWLSEVVWSPHEKYIAFVAGYRDACGGDTCFRFHIYVANLQTGQLYALGEGRHVGWTNGGEGINFFRLIGEDSGRDVAHLYTARPDGSARQEIWLPGGAVYVSAEQTPLGLPWNDSGTRVLVGNAGLGEVMLFNLADRAFTTPVVVPDKMPRVNRLAVELVLGEQQLLWTTIRGEFALQRLASGRWQALASDASVYGVPPLRVRVFPTGTQALIELADGSAYVLDIATDTLIPVSFGQ